MSPVKLVSPEVCFAAPMKRVCPQRRPSVVPYPRPREKIAETLIAEAEYIGDSRSPAYPTARRGRTLCCEIEMQGCGTIHAMSGKEARGRGRNNGRNDASSCDTRARGRA